MKYKILAIDDDQKNLLATQLLLEEFGYEVDTASSAQEALSILDRPYAAILIDYRMPDMNGAELALEISKRNPSAAKIMYSCDESRSALKYSLRAGVEDFVDKDTDPKLLLDTLARVCSKFDDGAGFGSSVVEFEGNRKLLESVGMIGQSPLMAEVARKCLLYRNSREVITIFGETGAGKELVAKAAHDGAPDTLFAINCAGFSDGDVTEGELFGYEKGTFTGAATRKIGIFERAGTGTVFLDEVEKLPVRTQGALLRAVREGKIRRKGGESEIEIRCRIIAAAKPNLRELVDAKAFLPDLYYRLNFLTIEVPPLRQRTEDIPLLVRYFCDKYEEKSGVRKGVSTAVLNAFVNYEWPGNIGELVGCMSKLLIDSKSDVIGIADLDARFNLATAAPGRIADTIPELMEKHEFEKRELILRAVRESTSQRRAAQRVGISESFLRKVLGRSSDRVSG